MKKTIITDEFLNYVENQYKPLTIKSVWISFNQQYMFWGTAAFQYFRNLLALLTGKKRDLTGTTLNIGAGLHPIKDVLNSEFIPTIKNTILFKKDSIKKYFLNLEFLDMSASNADAVILSHVIEHIHPSKTMVALTNCFNLLKPGGCVRIAVPDVKKYLLEENIPDTQKFKTRFVALNQLVYCHGHQIMFDLELLHDLLQYVGFIDLVEYQFNQGPLGAFDTIASKEESIYIVATKPLN